MSIQSVGGGWIVSLKGRNSQRHRLFIHGGICSEDLDTSLLHRNIHFDRGILGMDIYAMRIESGMESDVSTPQCLFPVGA